MNQTHEQSTTYTSTLPYAAEGVRAAAVYCSDGRFGGQCEDFLRNSLSIEKFDLIVMPGGPARLSGYDEPGFDENAVLEELAFLIEAHKLDRVVLIQHADCGHYQHKLGISPQDLRPLQESDLTRAAKAVRKRTGLDNIEGYYAESTSNSVRFVPVPLSD